MTGILTNLNLRTLGGAGVGSFHKGHGFTVL